MVNSGGGRKSSGKKRQFQKGGNRPDSSVQSANIDFINKLNDTCLVQIFKLLPIRQQLTINAVCKRWQQVSNIAWSSIKALNFKQKQGPSWGDDPSKLLQIYPGNECFERILKLSGAGLEELELQGKYPASILPLIAQNCRNLLRLVIEFDEDGGDPSQLLQQMWRLTYFGMKNRRKFFDGNFFQSLPETLTELHLTEESAQIVLTNSVFLKPEDLGNLNNLTTLNLNGFALRPEIVEIISLKRFLTSLSLVHCTVSDMLGDFQPLIGPDLVHLNLSHNIHVNDSFLFYVSRTCIKLKSLNISRNQNLTNRGLRHLLKFPQLEELNVSDTESIADAVFSTMINLKKLECEDCPRVKAKGINELMKRAPKLQSLNLAGTSVTSSVLCTAYAVTNKRRNNVPLRLFVSPYVTGIYNIYNNPPRLTIHVRDERIGMIFPPLDPVFFFKNQRRQLNFQMI